MLGWLRTRRWTRIVCISAILLFLLWLGLSSTHQSESKVQVYEGSKLQARAFQTISGESSDTVDNAQVRLHEHTNRETTPGPSDATWNKFVQRGRQKLAAMQASVECAAAQPNVYQTSWQAYSDLEKYGWTQTTPTDPGNYIKSFGPFKKAWVALGLAQTWPPNLYVDSTQNQDSEVNGITYTHTYGNMESIFNAQDGILVIVNAFSPKYAAANFYERYEEKKYTGNIVPLDHWSDVMFLDWEHFTGDSVNSLTKVLIDDVINSDSKAAIWKALQARNINSMPNWPGETFDVNEESELGLALLGCTNIHGIANFLFQHKQALGVKVINSITIWDEEIADDKRNAVDTTRPNALIEIVDVQTPAGSSSSRKKKGRRGAQMREEML